MIVARHKEVSKLLGLVKSKRSEFVALYGRRRVGKTFLINELFEGKFVFRHSGVANGNKKAQLFEFSASLKEYGLASFEMPSNWLEAFELLKQLLKQSHDKKKIVFLDELSWMDTRGSDLIMALESFWNGWAESRKDVMLIVCASATSWMMRKVIHAHGGLHNRLTERIALQPFTLHECKLFSEAYNFAYSPDQIIEAYMVFGGVPYYWSLMRRENSLAQNVDALCFAEDAPLKDEFLYMYSSLFSYPKLYIETVKLLATRKVGMTRNELMGCFPNISGGELTKVLEDLENCSLIRSYTAFGKKRKDSLYQLMDNFTLFHFKFMDNRPKDPHFWSHQYSSPSANAWRGLAFERVCLWHHEQIKRGLGISGILTKTCSWNCKSDEEEGIYGTQIDLVIDRSDKIVTLCGIKYSADSYVISNEYEAQLRQKLSSFSRATKTRKGIQLAFICNNGLTRNANAWNVHTVITAEDLFAPSSEYKQTAIY